MKPMVTVVMPTYNRAHLLSQALHSIFGQSWRPIEVIVVDDASRDDPASVVAASPYASKIIFQRLERNGGPAVARNAGLSIARGQYVAFFDSDDLWLPHKLARQIQACEADSQRGRLVSYSPVWMRRPHEVLRTPWRGITPGERVGDYLFLHRGYIALPTIVMPTALAQEAMFNAELRMHEDWDLLLRLEASGARFQMVEEPLAVIFDDSNVNRASADRPQHSLALSDVWRPLLSELAYLAFRARMAPQLRSSDPQCGLQLILRAWQSSAISSSLAVSLLGTLAHPGLRTAAYRLRGQLRASQVTAMSEDVRRMCRL